MDTLTKLQRRSDALIDVLSRHPAATRTVYHFVFGSRHWVETINSSEFYRLMSSTTLTPVEKAHRYGPLYAAHRRLP